MPLGPLSHQTGSTGKHRPGTHSHGKPLLLEAVMIVFAVMLGLFANEWRENAGQRRKARDAKSKILMEIQHNRDDLSGSIGTQESFVDSLTRLLISGYDFQKVPDGLVGVLMKIDGGIHYSNLTSLSWETVKATGLADHFDFDYLRDMAQIQELTKMGNVMVERLMALIYREESYRPEQTEGAAKTLIIMVENLLRTEKNLLEVYDRILASPS